MEDLTVAGCLERIVRLAVDSFGRLDGLVNNAAIITNGDIHSTDSASFNRTLAVTTCFCWLAPFPLFPFGTGS